MFAHGKFGGVASRKMMCVCVLVHKYDLSFKGGIAVWEGPIAYLMFVKCMKTNVRRFQ